MDKRVQKKKNRSLDRYTALIIAMIFIFVGIIAKLAYLQVVKAEDFKEKANLKGIREIPEFAPRGNILDCNGNYLAKNKNSYILIYNEGEESNKEFYTTMEKVFKILAENSESLKDDFQLKTNPFSFQFKAEDDKDKKALEIRFKRDRGLNAEVRNKLVEKKIIEDKEKLTEEDENKINKELLKIPAEQVFYKLVKQYELYRLIDNSQEFCKKMSDKKTDPKKITELLLKKYSLEDIRRYLLIKDTLKMQSFSGYKPVIVANDIKKETAFIFYQRLNELPGIDVTIQPLREYPNKEVGSAFLGYISKINGGISDKYEARGYDVSTDYVGMAGLESAFEDRLKGSKGGRMVKLNTQGRVIHEMGERESYPGQSLQLTINLKLQTIAEKAMDDTTLQLQSEGSNHKDKTDTSNATRGGIVVLDVNTGGVLALVSRPGFDPNDFATPGKFEKQPEIYNKYFNPDLTALGEEYIKKRKLDTSKVSLDTLFPIDTNASTDKKIVRKDFYDVLPKPMFNYALQGFSQPGSTFKPLTAIAGLEEGVIDINTKINDLGEYTNNGYKGKCWALTEQGYTHGEQNVVEALANSCNYFFFDVGDRLNRRAGTVKEDVLAKYAWKFGLGVDPKGNAKKSTGIEIYENFGNTSNLEYIKEQITFYRIDDMVKYLKKKNVDLIVHSEDSEEVRTLKNDILDMCKKRMIDIRSKKEIEFSKELKEALKQVVNKSPQMNGKVTNGDIGAIVTMIIRMTIDANAEIYTPANIYDASIGQGFSRFTPVQLANYMATVVNGGNRYKVHLVDKFLDAKGNVIEQVKPEVVEKVNLKPTTLEAVMKGLEKVTGEGTASYTFGGFPIPNGGKTGSATFNNDQHNFGREAFGVYVGYAPLENPKIAVCVVVYDGAHGGNVAPVAKAIYETYFKDEILSKDPNYQFMYPTN